jgi:hypothetical protein
VYSQLLTIIISSFINMKKGQHQRNFVRLRFAILVLQPRPKYFPHRFATFGPPARPALSRPHSYLETVLEVVVDVADLVRPSEDRSAVASSGGAGCAGPTHLAFLRVRIEPRL